MTRVRERQEMFAVFSEERQKSMRGEKNKHDTGVQVREKVSAEEEKWGDDNG